MTIGYKTGGRKPGVTNKVTKEFRETVRRLLDDNQENFAIWLSQVANGYGDKEGDPAKAIDLLVKLAEYGAPKLARTEHIGENGSAIKFEVTMPWLQQQVQSRNQ